MSGALGRSTNGTRVFHLYSYGPTAERPVAVGALEVTRDDNLAFIEGNLFVDPPNGAAVTARRSFKSSKPPRAISDARRWSSS